MALEPDRHAATRNRGIARQRALSRLASRHIEEFQRLWKDEAAKLGTTAGRFTGQPEYDETPEQRDERLIREEVERERLRTQTALSLVDLLRS